MEWEAYLMRILFVWVAAIAMIFLISLGWYTTLPVVLGVSRGLNSTYYENANARNIATAVEYLSYGWGPILIGFVLLWALISSAKRDVESEVYG